MTNDHIPAPSPETEPIYRLLHAMAPRRAVFSGIMDLCVAPQSLKVIAAEVERLQANNQSVYTAASFCMTLEEVGALERVTEDGAPYGDLDLEPCIVEDADGSHRYETPEAPTLFWRTTDAARAVLAADDPVAAAHAVIDEEGAYLPIYRRVLELGAAASGCTTKDLGRAVDDDPLVQDPRLFAGHFIERLESVGCLAWSEGAWRATDLGRAIAAKIAE